MELLPPTEGQISAKLGYLRLAAELCGTALPLRVLNVQWLYDHLLDGSIENDGADVATGIAFGEVLIFNARFEYEWVWCESEAVSELSVAPKGFWGVSHPITMIDKRLQRNEEVDVLELCCDCLYTIEKRISDGSCAPRIGSES